MITKLSIQHTNIVYPLLTLLVMTCLQLAISNPSFATIQLSKQSSSSGNLSEEDYNDFGPNQIIFYDPTDCEGSGGTSSICGSDAREMYWSALRERFSPEATAGIFGNIDAEGGFSPVGVESCSWLWPYSFANNSWGNGWPSWEYFFDNDYSQNGSPTGVGAFGITFERSKYLHYVNDNAPDLIKYFQYPDKYAPILDGCRRRDPSAKTPGDDVLNQIGANDFGRLVQLEIDWMYQTISRPNSGFNVEAFDKMSVSDAAVYFLTTYERPANMWSAASPRAALAQKDYDEFKDFVCINSSVELKGSGDFKPILEAKNADKSYFNHSGDVDSANWSDKDKESMKRILETYGDLAYQLGRAIGAPWIAILVQMRYEDGYSECGRNNFWGNGCDKNHSCIGCATIQGDTLGEGFTQYGKTLTEYKGNGSTLFYAPVLGTSDPKEYLEKIGPRWVNGKTEGAGYGQIEAMKDSVDALTAYIKSEEGKKIVESFHDWNGINYNSKESSDNTSSSSSNSSSTSSSSSSSTASYSGTTGEDSIYSILNLDDLSPTDDVDGSQITFLGDSLIGIPGVQLFEEYFGEADHGEDYNSCYRGNMSTYICSGKTIDTDMGVNGGPGGYEILKQIVEKGELRPILVFHLGGNGGWTEDRLNRILDLAGNNTQVVFFTNKFKAYPDNSELGQFYIKSNNIIKEAAKKYDNVTVGDWASLVKDEWFGSDGLHNTTEGSKVYFKFIHDTIASIKNGCTTYEGDYPQYNQYDPQWGSMTFSDGCTMATCGCGASAMAMLATVAAGEDVLPTDVINLTKNTGYYWDRRGSTAAELNKIVGDKYDLEVVAVPVNESSKTDVIDKMRQYLQDGYMLHFSGSGSCPYPSSSGHYVGLFSIDSGDNVRIADSGFSNSCPNTMKLADVVNAGYHGDAFTAVRKKGASKKNCEGSTRCKDKDNSNTVADGGIKDRDEADEKIMAPYRDLYNHSELWSKYNLFGGPDNCVSFTKYFITKYTTLDFHGEAMGDGGAVAGNFYKIFKDRYPDLTISDKPSAYSVASCGDLSYNVAANNYSHTFIVLGVDESKGKMIVGEAGFGSSINFTTAKEKSLTDAVDASHNGSGSVPCTFVNVNKYIKDL